MKQIVLTGTGGQGLILAGIILAEAAVLDGKQAIQTQSYGPEARGGASRAEATTATAKPTHATRCACVGPKRRFTSSLTRKANG